MLAVLEHSLPRHSAAALHTVLPQTPFSCAASHAAPAVNATNTTASLTDRGKEEVTRNGTATFTSLQLQGFINQSYPLVVRWACFF